MVDYLGSSTGQTQSPSSAYRAPMLREPPLMTGSPTQTPGTTVPAQQVATRPFQSTPSPGRSGAYQSWLSLMQRRRGGGQVNASQQTLQPPAQPLNPPPPFGSGPPPVQPPPWIQQSRDQSAAYNNDPVNMARAEQIRQENAVRYAQQAAPIAADTRAQGVGMDPRLSTTGVPGPSVDLGNGRTLESLQIAQGTRAQTPLMSDVRPQGDQAMDPAYAQWKMAQEQRGLPASSQDYFNFLHPGVTGPVGPPPIQARPEGVPVREVAPNQGPVGMQIPAETNPTGDPNAGLGKQPPSPGPGYVWTGDENGRGAWMPPGGAGGGPTSMGPFWNPVTRQLQSNPNVPRQEGVPARPVQTAPVTPLRPEGVPARPVAPVVAPPVAPPYQPAFTNAPQNTSEMQRAAGNANGLTGPGQARFQYDMDQWVQNMGRGIFGPQPSPSQYPHATGYTAPNLT